VEILNKWLTVIVVVTLLVIAGVTWVTIERRSHEGQLAELRNAVASRDATIETSVGVFQRLAMEHGNLSVALDIKDAQVKSLVEDLKKNHEELLVANTLSIKWKKAYEGMANAEYSHEDGGTPDSQDRDVVAFHKDFGYIFVYGYTKTNPVEAYIKLEQRRPLRLTMVVSQKEDDSWVTHVTSSEENVGVDIQLAAVNPKLLDYHWCERLGLMIDLGGGPNGFLGGIGVSAQFGKFELGPKIWAVYPAGTGTGVAAFYGVSAIWHPFSR
jgi:hypothetical protein